MQQLPDPKSRFVSLERPPEAPRVFQFLQFRANYRHQFETQPFSSGNNLICTLSFHLSESLSFVLAASPVRGLKTTTPAADVRSFLIVHRALPAATAKQHEKQPSTTPDSVSHSPGSQYEKKLRLNLISSTDWQISIPLV